MTRAANVTGKLGEIGGAYKSGQSENKKPRLLGAGAPVTVGAAILGLFGNDGT